MSDAPQGRLNGPLLGVGVSGGDGPAPEAAQGLDEGVCLREEGADLAGEDLGGGFRHLRPPDERRGVPGRAGLLLLGEGGNHHRGGLHLGHGEMLCARGEEEGDLEIPGNTREGEGRPQADLPGLKEFEDLGREAVKEGEPGHDPAPLPAEEPGDLLRRKPFVLGEVPDDDGLVVVGERAAAAVEADDHGFGRGKVPALLDDGGDGGRPLSPAGLQPLESVHDFKPAIDGNDGDGLGERPPGRDAGRALEGGEARPDFPEGDVQKPHGRPLARGDPRNRHEGKSGRERTWKKG